MSNYTLNSFQGNAAYIALAAADDGVGGDEFKKFALSQINYALGDNKQHMSFEIGYGNNFPRKPHHKARSLYQIYCRKGFQ